MADGAVFEPEIGDRVMFANGAALTIVRRSADGWDLEEHWLVINHTSRLFVSDRHARAWRWIEDREVWFA